MWKEAVAFTKQLLSLTRDVQQNKADIKELRDEVRELRQEFSKLTLVVERLASEWRHDRENAEKERELQRLRLENILLRFERGLPPGGKTEEDDKK